MRRNVASIVLRLTSRVVLLRGSYHLIKRKLQHSDLTSQKGAKIKQYSDSQALKSCIFFAVGVFLTV